MNISDESCIFLVATIILIYWIIRNQTEDFSNSPLIYDDYIPNRNAFRNYYRASYEQSQHIGWKPELDWDYLRPEKGTSVPLRPPGPSRGVIVPASR